jgi:hypothetical protein
MASQRLESFGHDIPDEEWKKIDDINACLKSILPALQEIWEKAISFEVGLSFYRAIQGEERINDKVLDILTPYISRVFESRGFKPYWVFTPTDLSPFTVRYVFRGYEFIVFSRKGVLHVSEITREGETVLNISPRYVRSSGLTHDIEGYELNDQYPFCKTKRD